MVTRHSYSMYCTSSTITIGNTETPLPSLLVTSWRRVGHPKMPSLFGEDVTLHPSCTIQSPNEDKISSPSVSKSVTTNTKTAGSHLSPSIANADPLIHTEEAAELEFWARFQSWTFCDKCAKLEPRKLLPAFRGRAPTPLHNTCKCSNGTYVVPDVDDVPLLLRNVTIEDQ